MGKEAEPAISKHAWLYWMSGVWGKKNFDNWLAVSRGRSFCSCPLVCIDSERWISCSTESTLAVPSADSRFFIIIKPLETIKSILLQRNDVKCQGNAQKKGPLPMCGFQLTQLLFRPAFDLYAQAKQDGAIGILDFAIGQLLDENLVECL